MYFSKEFLHSFKSKINILELASEYTLLKKIDKNTYQGRCPHPNHRDSDPSFTVFLDTQSWCCLGCHNGKKTKTENNKDCINYGSDVIAFIQWIKNISWYKAIFYLSEKYNIPLPSDEDNAFYKKQLIKANVFNKHLHTKKTVLEYLYFRGLSIEDINKYKIGFDGYRIVFPIFDINNNILGFTRRKYYDFVDRKYRNSKTSDYFQKRKILYGLHNYDNSCDTIYITEGCFDVILATKYGLKNVFAPLGTAFTEEQAELISKFNKKIVLIYDGDEAGDKAMIKSVDLLNNLNIYPDVIRLEEGNDLAEVALKYKNNLKNYIAAKKMPYNLYLINNIYKEHQKELYNINHKYISEYLNIVDNIKSKKEQTIVQNFLKQYCHLDI